MVVADLGLTLLNWIQRDGSGDYGFWKWRSGPENEDDGELLYVWYSMIACSLTD